MTKMVGKSGRIYYSLKFHTFSFHSFSCVFEDFYKTGKKKVPHNIGEFLSPFALPVWIMMDGNFNGFGIRLHCNAFDNEDQIFLQHILFEKYGFQTTRQKTNDQYILYVPKKHFSRLKEMVRPFFHQSM